jgi:hypothetical protein
MVRYTIIMVTLTLPITIPQLLDLVRQLSPEERRKLMDALLAERFDTTLAETDRVRGSMPAMTDQDIQAEVDVVRTQRRQDRHRSAGG